MTSTQDRAKELIEATEELRGRFDDGVPVSTSRLVNPLLDLWAIAASLGDDVTGPIERLLTVYAGPRDLAMPSELDELLGDLRSVLEPALV
ncbi:MAG TPA: hypothetical protein VE990_17125 [Acidimicrobiales bacterium]|nr:hypothetical protein [Acidimicrobiales bacterium]